MPTYEYECKSCGHSFEAFQSMSDDPLKECPECGKEIRRLINGGTGIIFKGSGFYVTDKKSGNSGAGSKAKDKPVSETAGTESGGEPRAVRPPAEVPGAAAGRDSGTASAGEAKPAGNAEKSAAPAAAKT
jgi:putative FmdB family regulatory protein